MLAFDVLIVGGGQGGAQAAIALRQGGYAGSIAIVSMEPDLPYERPPLSKEYFADEKTFDRLLLRPASYWQQKEVALLLDQKVALVDADAKQVETQGGERLAFGKLVWATGGSPRQLSCDGHHFSGIHHIRSRSDVDSLKDELGGVHRVAVVGGGYIGLESAAVLRKLGKGVVLFEAAPRLLARVAGEPLSRFFAAEHRAQGVDIHLNCAISALEGSGGRVSGVCLANGRTEPCDLVIVGVGIEPASGPLAAAGADCSNGVEVDGYCRTSLPDIFAIGDVAAHHNQFAAGARIRLESIQNANDQANLVARQIIGEETRAYDAVPWFWSNQYDLRLQTVGLSVGYDQCLLRGDPATRKFSVVYLRGGRVIALDCVNNVRDYVQGKALVVAGARIPTADLANSDVPLKLLGGSAAQK